MALKESADALLRGAVEKGDVPGVVALATTASGTIYEGGFGVRALGAGAAMTADTVVWIASMTKALTATAAMQLVERGKLDLDGAAAQWLPALGAVQVLDGFDAASKPRLRPANRPITLRHLLTHTAGFAYEIWSPDIIRYQQATGTPGIITCENASLGTPLLFDPGERWMYGISIDWVGKIVEAVAGKRLGAYMKENIFDPMGMSSTAFKITPAMRARLAKIHQRGEDGALQPLDLELTQEPEFDPGGGGLYSTAGDYARFVRMILNRGTGEGGRVLKPETVDLMSRNAIGDKRVVQLASAIPALSNDAEFFPGSPKSWGLSFMINDETAPTGRSAGSLAWAGLANTFYWIDPTKGVGGVYLTQILPFADAKSAPLYLAFETAVYRAM
jgi:methyl acetate hydrolase